MMEREKFIITQPSVIEYAEVSGDPNPIHQSDEVARSMGLEGAIAHGMYVYSFLLLRLERWMRDSAQSGNHWQVLSTRCRFNDMAPIGRTFESILELSAETPEGAKMTLTCQSEEGKKLTQVVAHLKRS